MKRTKNKTEKKIAGTPIKIDAPDEPTGAPTDARGSAPERLIDAEPGTDGAANGTAAIETEAQPTLEQLEQLEQKTASLEDQLLRAKADFANFQRRMANERVEAVRYANADLMRSLLVVLDDLERSLAAVGTSDDVAAMVDGVRLVQQNLLKALTDHGLSGIEALHQPFDPSVHEAMMQQPSDQHPDQTVIEQIARGYRLHDRVLRPARVVVSKASEPQGDPVETALDLPKDEAEAESNGQT